MAITIKYIEINRRRKMSEEINEEKKTEETSSSKKLFAKTLKQYLDKSVEVSK